MENVIRKTKTTLVIQLAFLSGLALAPIQVPLWKFFLIIIGVGFLGATLHDLLTWIEKKVLAKG